jgi:hypothetical protein
MAGHARRRSVALRVAVAAILAQAGVRVCAVDKPPDCFELVAQVAPGFRTTKDQVMSCLWLEDANGRFVRTLWRFSRDKKWYKDLTVWHGLSTPVEADADVDAVTGATIIQGDSGTIRIPTRWKGLDLLSGRYVLRVESAKDHAKHYSSLRVRLNAKSIGGTIEDKGYIRSIKLRRCPPGTPVPSAPEAVVEAGADVVADSSVQSPTGKTGTSEHP